MDFNFLGLIVSLSLSVIINAEDELEAKSFDQLLPSLKERGLRLTAMGWLTKERVRLYGINPDHIPPNVTSSYGIMTALRSAGVDTNEFYKIFLKEDKIKTTMSITTKAPIESSTIDITTQLFNTTQWNTNFVQDSINLSGKNETNVKDEKNTKDSMETVTENKGFGGNKTKEMSKNNDSNGDYEEEEDEIESPAMSDKPKECDKIDPRCLQNRLRPERVVSRYYQYREEMMKKKMK